MARLWGFGKRYSNAQKWAVDAVRRVRKFNRQSAIMLAVLISAPVLAIGLVKADGSVQITEDLESNQLQDAETTLQNSIQIDSEPPVQTNNQSARANITPDAQSQNNASVNVNVKGSVTTTDENGNPQTETFEKHYSTKDGNVSNNFSVNVNASTSSNEADVDVDIDQRSEVRVRVRD